MDAFAGLKHLGFKALRHIGIKALRHAEIAEWTGEELGMKRSQRLVHFFFDQSIDWAWTLRYIIKVASATKVFSLM